MKVEVEGLDALLSNLKALGGDVTDEKIMKAMRENFADLKTAAVALAPHDSGTLEKSGKYRVRKKDGAVEGELVFDAQDEHGAPYAVYAHEGVYNLGPETRAKPWFDGQQPGRKYLQRPFKRYSQKYVDNLAEAVKQAIDDVSSG